MIRRRSQGFTLLELLLVLVLAGIVMGMSGLMVGHDPQRTARQEAGLFLQVVQQARQRAVLEGQTLGIRIDTDGYQLMLRTGQSWMPTGQRRSLSLSLRLEIDGLPAGLSRHGETAQLTFASNDEYTPFLLYFLEAGVRLAHVSSDGLNDPQLHL